MSGTIDDARSTGAALPWRLSFKLYFEQGVRLGPRDLVPVFHRWIRERTLGSILIDVADYSHVPGGPGVILVAHEGHYGVDDSEGRLGLRFERKRPQPGPFGQRLGSTLGAVLEAARELEREPLLRAPARLRTEELRFEIRDRLRAPNDGATLAALGPEVEAVLREVYGTGEVHLGHELDRPHFTLRVRAGTAPGVGSLLERLADLREPVPA